PWRAGQPQQQRQNSGARQPPQLAVAQPVAGTQAQEGRGQRAKGGGQAFRIMAAAGGIVLVQPWTQQRIVDAAGDVGVRLQAAAGAQQRPPAREQARQQQPLPARPQ